MGGVALVSDDRDTTTHDGHIHRGAFAIIRRRQYEAGGLLLTSWAWTVYGPAIAGIGQVPWWVCDYGAAPTWGEALVLALASVDTRRAAEAGARAANAGRPIANGVGHRPGWWRRRR